MSLLLPLLGFALLLSACQTAERKAAAGRPAPDSTASLFDDESDPLPAPKGPAAAPPVPGEHVLRVVSLKAVDRILSGCPGGPLCEDTLFRTLGGITSLQGIVFDERAGDPLLVGRIGGGRPPLHLEDLVAALRNAWLAYVQQKGNRITYLHPGLSLDPAPAALKELQKIGQDIARIDAAGGEKALDRWKETCRKPYKVTLSGLPPDSRFARTLLRADYAMKAMATGSENPGLHGFPGMAELRKIRFQGEQAESKATAPPLPSLTRYWFHPGSQEWEMGEGVVVLKRCPIMLMTEEMFERLRSGAADSGATAEPSDELAEAFAYGFTRMYDKVAETRPVFRELEGLYRLVAAAKLVRDRFPEGEAKGAFPALFGKWDLPPAGLASEVPGIPDLQHFDHARNTPMGMEIDRYWLPSCGGVAVAVEPGKAWIRRVRDQRLSAFRKSALSFRPSDTAWHWDVPGVAQDYWGNMRERLRLQELSQRFPKLAFFRGRRGEDRKALELVDEDDIVLRAGTPQALAEEIATRAEARKVPTAFVELAGWSAEQVEALKAAAAAARKGRKAGWTLVPVVNRPGWLSVENPIFTHSADWEQGEPPLEPMAAGPYKGWQRITFRFLTSAGGKTVPAALQVMVRSPEVAARLQEEAVKAFRTRLFIAYSPFSALTAVIDEFRDSLPEKDRDGLRIVEDEAGLIDLG